MKEKTTEHKPIYRKRSFIIGAVAAFLVLSLLLTGLIGMLMSSPAVYGFGGATLREDSYSYWFSCLKYVYQVRYRDEGIEDTADGWAALAEDGRSYEEIFWDFIDEEIRLHFIAASLFDSQGYLIGAANETREQMTACASMLDAYKTVVVYDPTDAKVLKQTAKAYGVETKATLVTFTSFLASLLDEGKLSPKKGDKVVVYQDPFQLARDLEETEEARRVIDAYATLHEMHLNRVETVWAGNILMAEYMPDVIRLVAERRNFNAKSLGESVIVTASPSEYTALKAAAKDVEILSIEDLILA